MILAELLVLSSLSAAAAAAPVPKARLAELESAMTAAESALTGGGAPCPSVAAVLKDAASGTLPRAAAEALDAGNDDLRLLFSCRAAASRSPSACEPLGARPARIASSGGAMQATTRPNSLRLLCRSDRHDLDMVRALASASRKDFVAACLEPDASGRLDFLPGRSAEACALLADGEKEPEAACAKLAPLYASGVPGVYCRGQFAFYAGDETHCATLGALRADQELCRAAAAFRHRGEKPALCAESPVCSAMSTGKDGSCSVYEKRALARVCREHYLPRSVDAILASLTSVERELESDEDLEAAARFRHRAELFLTRLVDAQNPAWSPAAAPATPPSEARLAALEGAARGAGHPACLANSNPEEVLAVLRDSAISPAAREALLTAASPWLERLFTARAFAASGPDACDALSSLTLDLPCKTGYHEALMAGAFIRADPDGIELCRKRNLAGDRYFRLDSLDKSCRIFAENTGGVVATCEALSPYFDHVTSGATCPRLLRQVSGDETVCPQFEGEARARCEGYAAYRKAGSRGAKACGGSGLCELLKGEFQGPERRAAEGLARAACGVFERADVRAELAKQLSAQAESHARELAEAGTNDAEVERSALLQARALRLAAP